MNHPELTVLLEIVDRASKLVFSIYNSSFQVDYKGPRDPVTTADRAANELLCDEIARAFPGVPIVAEESLPETFAGYAASTRIFFVDPVDGTQEFVERNGQFVVMVGLVDGARPTLSVIQAPAFKVTWAGAVGYGAFRRDDGGQLEPVKVTDVETLAGARIVSSRSHRSVELERTLGALGAKEIAILGSAGLKGSEVARGAAEAYVAPDYAGKRWDACPAEALVLAAGGRFTDSNGELIDYRAESLANATGVVASNGRVHDEIIRKLEAHRAHS